MERIEKLKKLASNLSYREEDFETEFLPYYEDIDERHLNIFLNESFDCGAMCDYYFMYEYEILNQDITPDEYHFLENLLSDYAEKYGTSEFITDWDKNNPEYTELIIKLKNELEEYRKGE